MRTVRLTPTSRTVRRQRWATAALALLLSGVLVGCAALDEQQRRWIFQPTDRTWAGGLAAAEGMQDVWIEFCLLYTSPSPRD